MRRLLVIHAAVVMYIVRCGLRGIIPTVRESVLIAVARRLQWAGRAASFVLWRLSRRASAVTLEHRMGLCFACKAVDPDDTGIYCGACGCPKWRASELHVKNSRRFHNCPLGIHPGSVRLTTIGGCKGCGKKANGNGQGGAMPQGPRPQGGMRRQLQTVGAQHSGGDNI